MSRIDDIFDRLESITQKEGQSEFIVAVIKDLVQDDEKNKSNDNDTSTYQLLHTFLLKIISAIDELSSEILNNSSILISVKNQKILRTCFQLVTSIGICNCLIPGLGVSLTRRCTTTAMLPTFTFKDEEKYELLVDCTNFFNRSYKVPVIKNIIVTLHLSDYLAALMQLAFAPLKKPGTYSHFTMTQERYDKLNEDRKQFITVYEHLVANCFQPALMKELLVLQSVTQPPPPPFIKRVIAKELSRRLLAPGGLLSLIRCLIESYNIDTGFEWKKVDMICRLLSVKHGSISENDYISNITSQLGQILSMNNTHYLATAVACVLSLKEKYPDSCLINNMIKDSFQAFDCNSLRLKLSLPGTIVLSPQEVSHNVNILHTYVCSVKFDWPVTLLSPNLYVLFKIASKCSKHEDLQTKLRDILLKILEKLSRPEVEILISKVLFDKNSTSADITVEEYDSGIAIKSGLSKEKSDNKELLYLITLFKASTQNNFIKTVFEASLDILINVSIQRNNTLNKDLLALEDEPVILDDVDEQYATLLQLLTEISMLPKVTTALKNDSSIVINFIEHFLSRANSKLDEECMSVALVLLNTVLASSKKNIPVENKFVTMIPLLKKMSQDESSFNHILCKEALSLMASDVLEKTESACGRAISDVFDNLLPVRAHGIMELSKLIDAKDPETISKRHYILCLFQEQLKDPDSYIYLSAVNGLAALCTHCTEDVLHVLCKEFLEIPSEQIETNGEKKAAETRMKIGDVIVKVTKRLGMVGYCKLSVRRDVTLVKYMVRVLRGELHQPALLAALRLRAPNDYLGARRCPAMLEVPNCEMAVVHKTALLNTMLCACRDNDPLIRTSALSNLAEIVLVLHYKIGNIIYELLLCIWGIIETDKAVECRRAAVMVISSLLKGLGQETLLQLKENLLPMYRTLNNVYKDDNEDSVVRLHAQIALEELNSIVKQFLLPEVKMEKRIFVLD